MFLEIRIYTNFITVDEFSQCNIKYNKRPDDKRLICFPLNFEGLCTPMPSLIFFLFYIYDGK